MAILWRATEKPTLDQVALCPALQALACPSILATFRAANATLDRIQAQLSSYLSAKRAAFPRFHFISDAELLDILSHTRDVRAVQPHVPQLFEGAARLELAQSTTTLDVVAMVSAEGEALQLGRPLKARGPPEGALRACLAAARWHLHTALRAWPRDRHIVRRAGPLLCPRTMNHELRNRESRANAA